MSFPDTPASGPLPSATHAGAVDDLYLRASNQINTFSYPGGGSQVLNLQTVRERFVTLQPPLVPGVLIPQPNGSTAFPNTITVTGQSGLIILAAPASSALAGAVDLTQTFAAGGITGWEITFTNPIFLGASGGARIFHLTTMENSVPTGSGINISLRQTIVDTTAGTVRLEFRYDTAVSTGDSSKLAFSYFIT